MDQKTKKKFMAAFLADVEELFGVMQESLATLQKTPNDIDALSELMRVFHSLKSSSAMMGDKDLSTASERMEKRFQEVIKEKGNAATEDLETVEHVVKQIEHMLESVHPSRLPVEISQDILEETAKAGVKEVSAALSKLSGQPVTAEINLADSVPIVDSLEQFKSSAEGAIVAHAQVVTGVSGVSLLILSREDALKLVDLLNKRSVGETGILKDIDRSAVKETLNILSNTFLNELSRRIGKTIEPSAPSLVTSKRLEEVVEWGMKKGDEEAILFGMTLKIGEHAVTTHLFLLFDAELAEMLK